MLEIQPRFSRCVENFEHFILINTLLVSFFWESWLHFLIIHAGLFDWMWFKSLYLVYTDSETGCTAHNSCRSFWLDVILCHCIWFILIVKQDVQFWKQCFFFPVMQALYFCAPFREQLLEYYANSKNIGDAEENLLTCLADLFTQVIIITPWIVFESYLC